MKDIKSMLYAFALGLTALTVIAASQEWNLGSSDDWLGSGPVYNIGPFYYPNSDLPLGTQQFLNTYNTYPIYMPFSYPGYYSSYNPAVLNVTGTYTPNYYLPGYNPYYYDPQRELELAAANHAYEKALTNYSNRYYGTYPYYNDPQGELDYAIANHAYEKSLTNYYNRYYRTYPY